MNKTDFVTFLVLDYKKPEETKLCLRSIRQHAKVKHQIVYLDNGSNAEYPWALYQEGLADVIISKKNGNGGGVGQTDLFRYCESKYAYFVQSDQVLLYDIDDDMQNQFISLFDQGAKVIDLNGDQSYKGIWTDRAHLIDVEFFNSLAPFPNGGPGPLHHLRWNENYLQEVFNNMGNPIAHVKPALFADNGVFTIRELPGGGIVKMRTDTKQVWWEVKPTEKYIFPEMTDQEWEDSISGNWLDGTIPETYLKNGSSFKHW